MISYAQLREDVLLHRALHHVPHDQGFYIDVGAYHPTADSVTRHFYDHGWCGINVEPAPNLFAPFLQERPRDINLQVAISDRSGSATFFDVDGQLSTLEDRFAERHASNGLNVQSYTVPCLTLAELCATHATRTIHFLKIDIEGHEAAAIRGMDFGRFRPWILVVEATEPNNWLAPTYSEWDRDIRAGGYHFAYTDVLNRYYVAEERSELLRHFNTPPDTYIKWAEAKRIEIIEAALQRSSTELAAALSSISTLEGRLIDYEAKITRLQRSAWARLSDLWRRPKSGKIAS